MNAKRIQKLVKQLTSLDEIKVESFYDENGNVIVNFICPCLFNGEENEIYPASRELCYRLANAINAAIKPIIAAEITAINAAIREEV